MIKTSLKILPAAIFYYFNTFYAKMDGMEKARRSQRRKSITFGAKNRKCLGRPEEMQKPNQIQKASKKIKNTAKNQLEKAKKLKTKVAQASPVEVGSRRDDTKQVAHTQKQATKTTQQTSSPSLAQKNTDDTSQSHEPQPKSKLSWYELTVLGIIGVSGVAIVIAAIVGLNFDPWKSVEKEMNAIVKDYYISYLYPRLTKDDSAESLEAYQESGIPTTYLRQLLSFDDAKFAKSSTAFSNQYYVCDTNSTGVRYYPYAPYGPEDYRTEYYWSCQDLTE